jgi:spermidine synthase
MKITSGKLLKRIETENSYIEVRENKNYRWMSFDKEVIQTLVNKKLPHESTLGHIKELLNVFNFIKKPREILMMGLGGGALIHSLKYHYPEVHTTAVEISKDVIELAKEFFYLSASSNYYSLICGDIQDYLIRPRKKIDIIFVDMYIDGEMPDFYYEPVFHRKVHKNLKMNGVAAYNLLCDKAHEFEVIVKLIREAFEHQTLCVPVDKFHNVILYAFKSAKYKDFIYEQEQQRSLKNLTYDIQLGLIGNL